MAIDPLLELLKGQRLHNNLHPQLSAGILDQLGNRLPVIVFAVDQQPNRKPASVLGPPPFAVPLLPPKSVQLLVLAVHTQIQLGHTQGGGGGRRIDGQGGSRGKAHISLAGNFFPVHHGAENTAGLLIPSQPLAVDPQIHHVAQWNLPIADAQPQIQVGLKVGIHQIDGSLHYTIALFLHGLSGHQLHGADIARDTVIALIDHHPGLTFFQYKAAAAYGTLLRLGSYLQNGESQASGKINIRLRQRNDQCVAIRRFSTHYACKSCGISRCLACQLQRGQNIGRCQRRTVGKGQPAAQLDHTAGALHRHLLSQAVFGLIILIQRHQRIIQQAGQAAVLKGLAGIGIECILREKWQPDPLHLLRLTLTDLRFGLLLRLLYITSAAACERQDKCQRYRRHPPKNFHTSSFLLYPETQKSIA